MLCQKPGDEALRAKQPQSGRRGSLRSLVSTLGEEPGDEARRKAWRRGLGNSLATMLYKQEVLHFLEGSAWKTTNLVLALMAVLFTKRGTCGRFSEDQSLESLRFFLSGRVTTILFSQVMGSKKRLASDGVAVLVTIQKRLPRCS